MLCCRLPFQYDTAYSSLSELNMNNGYNSTERNVLQPSPPAVISTSESLLAAVNFRGSLAVLTADRSCNRLSVPLRRGLVQEGVTEEKAMQLVVEFPSFFTLPPAARERVGLFLGEVRRNFPPSALLLYRPFRRFL